MARVGIFGLLLLAASVQAAQMEGNPMDKVFQLMDELVAKINKEGEAEEKAFKEYFEWCDDASGDLHRTLDTASKAKDKLEKSIEKATADIEAATTSIEELAGKIATAEADLKAATEIREKEAAQFATDEDELAQGVDMLGRAIGVLGASASSLLQKKVDTNNMKALISTLNVALSHASVEFADKDKLLAMVQEQSSDQDSDMDAELGAPAAASYESKSGGITGCVFGICFYKLPSEFSLHVLIVFLGSTEVYVGTVNAVAGSIQIVISRFCIHVSRCAIDCYLISQMTSSHFQVVSWRCLRK